MIQERIGVERRRQHRFSREPGNRRVLERSTHRITTGVCAGIAQYFDVDTIIVRIAFIILLILSCGLMIIPYCALAVMLPRENDKEGKPIDVAPAAIESDIYSRVVQDAEVKKQAAQTPGIGINAGIGHIPPASPVQNQADSSSSFDKAPQRALSEPTRPSVTQRSAVAATLVIALTALFIVVAKILVSQVSELSLVGFFPLLFVVVGTICLVCYTAELSLGVRMLCLVLCVELCMACLPFTTGLCPLPVLSRIGIEVWILLGIAVACALGGIVTRRLNVLMVAMCLFVLVLTLLYLEAGVFERVQALLTYSRHNLTSPLFRR